MNKEDVLYSVITNKSDSFEAFYKEDVVKAMGKYAKQIAIQFKKWCDNNVKDNFYQDIWYSNEQVFDLYLKSK